MPQTGAQPYHNWLDFVNRHTPDLPSEDAQQLAQDFVASEQQIRRNHLTDPNKVFTKLLIKTPTLSTDEKRILLDQALALSNNSISRTIQASRKWFPLFLSAIFGHS